MQLKIEHYAKLLDFFFFFSLLPYYIIFIRIWSLLSCQGSVVEMYALYDSFHRLPVSVGLKLSIQMFGTRGLCYKQVERAER